MTSRSELRRTAIQRGESLPVFDTTTEPPAALSGPAAGTPGPLSGAVTGETLAVPGPPGPAPRTWEITLPPGLKLLSLNGREHWAERHRVFQSIKQAAWAMTRNARVPRLDRIAVRVIYDAPDRRYRDPDNIAASAKPCVDGIVAAGVIPSDDFRYVASVTCEIGVTPRPMGRLRVIITEIGKRPLDEGEAA